MTNPLDTVLVLQAEYAHVNLVGPPSFTLAPHASDLFTFYFAPLVEGSIASSMKLKNQAIGEFWYAVNMDATAAAVQRLPQMEARVAEVRSSSA